MARKKNTPMVLSSFRLPLKDLDLTRRAAVREGVSQSKFLRRAILERAAKFLPAGGVSGDPDRKEILHASQN